MAMDGDLIIREARPEDRATIFNLYSDPEEAYGLSPLADRTQQEKLWLEVSQDHRQDLLVAELNGRVIGTLTLIVIPNLAHNGRPSAIIENVVVEAAHRNRGVGKALMSAAGKIAAERDCYKIVLSSNLVREKAHAFYEHLGWKQTHLGFSLSAGQTAAFTAQEPLAQESHWPD